MDKIAVSQSHWIALRKIADEPDGNLTVLEADEDIPFTIRRVYYITNIQNCVSIRGKHAHLTLQQVIFCVSGSFILSLDDGQRRQEVHMWQDNMGVYLGPLLWHTMHSFTTGCVLLVVASDPYDESDYIRDYETFLQVVRQPGQAP